MSADDAELPDLRLEDFPVFEAMIKRLADKGDHARISRMIREMLRHFSSTKLEKVGGRPIREVERSLWRRLRDVYADHLGESDRAHVAGRHLLRLEPVDVADRMTLAMLLARHGDLDEAAEQYAAALADATDRVEVLRQLVALHVRRQDHDAAGCVAGVLAHLGVATPQELGWVVRARRELLPEEPMLLPPEAWKLLGGIDAQPHVDAIFDVLARPVFDLRGRRPSTDTLDARFVPADLELPVFRSAFAWVTTSLGFPIRTHFADLDAEQTAPQSIAGARLDDEHGGAILRRALFSAGRQAIFHRPLHFVMFRHPTVTELTVLFFAAVALIRSETPIPAGIAKQVAAVTLILRRALREAEHARLADAVQRFIREGAVVNLKKWRREQELLAGRVGLLFSGDLAAAQQVLEAEAYTVDRVMVDDVMGDLASFAASGAYIALRRQLGLASDVVVH